MPTANWMTAAEISARYVVGEQRLLVYAHRGNLPLMRNPDGATLFDESVVARYFRPRNAAPVAAVPPDVRGIAVVGVSRLGAPPRTDVPVNDGASTPRAPRVERRRKARVGQGAWPAELERRKKAS
jgi:hypothetical protein